jgi:two-component system, NtrC family, sensor kinase
VWQSLLLHRHPDTGTRVPYGLPFKLAHESLDGGQRVSEITQRLRRFSRQERQEPVSVDLADCMETALRIGWSEIKNKCVIHRNYASPPPPVSGHPNQLTQVFLNLVVNAAQATPVRGGLTLEIGARDGRAIVKVRDEGRGIESENLDKLFAPFFTTKTAGTGLGLYVSKGIVEAHGGSIRAENAEGEGAVFTVEFPLAG